MEGANTCVERDVILKRRIESSKNVLEKYRVSKDSDFDGVEDDDALDLFNVDVGEELYIMESQSR